MCSIYGAIGNPSSYIIQALAKNATDRGRDGGRMEMYPLSNDIHEVWLGNWRATPTPELEVGELQPYNKMVHNGTIANDKELGAEIGEIDSQVLARVIDRRSVAALAHSLERVEGSYALAAFTGTTLLAATNYKPLHYASIKGSIYFSSMARHFAGLLPFGHAPVTLEPYTAIDFLTQEKVSITRRNGKRVVVIASSGLDSTVAATQLVNEGWDVCLLHFTYGCNAESRETRAIRDIGRQLACKSHILHVDLKQMLGLHSSTLFQVEVMTKPGIEGAEFAHEWVPGRNLVFISLAVAWAEAHGYHAVALGNNLEEAGAYPDNEEQFTTLLDEAMPYAVQSGYAMRLLSPVGNLMKHEIVRLGLEIDAPLHLTWSCYKGGSKHCGKCGPCFMRMKAFERNHATDPVFA